jgi:hypothetical protein
MTIPAFWKWPLSGSWPGGGGAGRSGRGPVPRPCALPGLRSFLAERPKPDGVADQVRAWRGLLRDGTRR